MSSSSLSSFLKCPITCEVFKKPVVASDGHTYEYEAIRKWLHTSDRSPMTGEKLKNKKLIPNQHLFYIIYHIYHPQYSMICMI